VLSPAFKPQYRKENLPADKIGAYINRSKGESIKMTKFLANQKFQETSTAG
jgi:hypothetical protein